MCARTGKLEVLDSYRSGAVEVRKPDHFTEQFEPFHAHRIENCISDLLLAGSELRELRFLDRGANRRIIAMEFARTA